MKHSEIIPPQARFASRFVTTHRNSILHWFAYLCILPLYLTTSYILIREIQLKTDAIIGTVLVAMIGGSLALPLLFAFLGPGRWKMGFKGREAVVLISVLISSPLFFDYEKNAFTLVAISFIWIIVGFARLLYILPINVTSIIIAFILLASSITYYAFPFVKLHPFADCFVPYRCIPFYLAWFVICLALSLYALYRLCRWYQSNYNNILTRNHYVIIALVIFLIEAALIVAFFKFDATNNADMILQAISVLLMLLIAAYPINFLSNQIAYMRALFRRVRRDYLYSQHSPSISPKNIFSWVLTNRIFNVFSIDNHNLYVIAILIVGGILIPATIYLLFENSGQITNTVPTINPGIPRTTVHSVLTITPTLGVTRSIVSVITSTLEITASNSVTVPKSSTNFLFNFRWQSNISPFELLTLGVISIVVLLFVYFTLWLGATRSRYIVTEFEIDNEDKDFKSELNSIAKLATHSLVDELQQIAALLKLRQVENLHFIREDNNAFFVTSGVEQEFFDQMEQVVSIEVPNKGKVSLTGLLSWFIRLLARIQVRGRVQRRSNNSVEIWVELKYRNNQSAAVDMIVLPENSLEEIDDVFIRPIARHLALKLLIELDQVSYLGSSWETLDYFLKGLAASADRNWWQAIAYYRKALQAEETIRGSFGIGHYHLGTALLFQGNWREGYEHLRIAEADGPPMAELQYMLALALLYIYWGEIHTKPNIFNEIDYRCAMAITLRREFPEAYQLRGSAYFRAARNQDRETSKQNSAIGSQKTPRVSDFFSSLIEAVTSPDLPLNIYNKLIDIILGRQKVGQPRVLNVQKYYRFALHFYWKALRGYDRMWRKTIGFRNTQEERKGYDNNLIQQRMTAAHQIGDALRSLGRFAEAESFYRDVSLIFPQNVRNQADLAKLYCLAENWQRAEEYLWQEVFKHPVAAWDADIAIHASWALSGGIYDHQTTFVKRWIDTVIRRFLRRIPDEYSVLQIPEVKQWLGETMEHLDFALYQRPRYINSWRQSNWLDSFKQAHTQLSQSQLNASSHTKYNWQKFGRFNFLDPDIDFYITWIGLRIRNCGENNYWADRLALFFSESSRNVNFKNFDFLMIQKDLIVCRKDAIKLDADIQTNKLLTPLHIAYRRLLLAQKLYDFWCRTRESFETLSISSQMTFAGRWALDLYYEVTLLTCRLLAESEAYEILHEVALRAFTDSEQWLNQWKNTGNYAIPENARKFDKPYYTFSPYVSRYQRATIRGWKAFAEYQRFFDPLTKLRNRSTLDEQNKEELHNLLTRIQKDIDAIRTFVPPHPLALFVQAHVFHKSGLHDQAIDVLEQLLDLIAPFDPKRDVGGSVLDSSKPNPTTSTERYTLYQMEKVAGRQQFHNIINPIRIHALIAEIYTDLEKPDLSVRHLMESVRWSPHHDVNADLFLRLSEQLSSMERFEEAQSAIEGIRVFSQKIYHSETYHTIQGNTSILECVINTRRMNYADSLQNCKKIAHTFTFFRLDDYIRNLKANSGIDPEIQGINASIETIILILGAQIRKQFDKSLPGFNDKFDNFSSMITSEDGSKGTDTKQDTFRTLGNTINEFVKHHTLGSDSRNSSENQYYFPKVFIEISHNKEIMSYLDDVAKLSLYTIHQASLSILLKNTASTKIEYFEEKFGTILFSQVVLSLSKHAYDNLNQFAELCNALAYNRIEMGLLTEQYAFIDSSCALATMAFLVQASDRDTFYHTASCERLAQYCDTYGWLYYRNAFIFAQQNKQDDPSLNVAKANESLMKSEAFLKQSIRYDPKRAIIHYHLSRLYLSRIELIWQSDPHTIYESTIGKNAQYIDVYLKNSLREWRNARQFDHFGRLHSRLSLLHNRINSYKRVWEKRQLMGIAGGQEPSLRLSSTDID